MVVDRLSCDEWHAVAGRELLGRGDASRRPDGRLFVSIDAWQGAVFDQLAAAMLADLPAPVHTVVDEADQDELAAWQRCGFTVARRESGYLVPTDPQRTGLGTVRPPAGVTVLPAGAAQEVPLTELVHAVRAEVEAAAGWHTMPAEILPSLTGYPVVDPARYAVARQGEAYLGLLRLGGPPGRNQPRIGLLAVRADQHRRGIARALLAQVLGEQHRGGRDSVWAEVDQANPAAVALFEGIGARRAATTLELVRG
ncbi:GNAT family N-acetyltransferase [Streptomyces tateyamensis]|uniref:GNAT family N-acetyltransferase n=1 Tax=Streptomyces tateyamensis TaxID=565073 RepID=A0A2V4NN85_9ACTN|nr:GNAT family N-acetyltransferase [Streptomyces tateyamensis]